jgi:small GTP-binding protein
MAFINEGLKEITLKLVYYGPGLSGKTTNLEFIHQNPKIAGKGKMISMSTESDRTLFFDFMPMELGSVGGYKIRVQLYTVPGQVFYDATRRLVLKGADGVVFVADSQKALLDADIESFNNLRDNLIINQIDPEKIPILLQYNKQDLPHILTPEELDRVFNPDKKHKRFLAVAPRGDGVLATLQAAIQGMIVALRRKVEAAAKEAPAASPSAEMPAPSAPEAVADADPLGAPAPAREETEEQKILKMLYQFNENTLLLMRSILEDIQKQQEIIKTLIMKEN